MGTNIKDIREQLNISQSQLAKALGISFSTVSRWETGHSSPNDSQMEQIDALKELLENKEIDKQKLRQAVLTLGLMASIFAATAAGFALKGPIVGSISGFLSKFTGNDTGSAINGEGLASLFKKGKSGGN